MQVPRKILIVKLGSIGDVVNTLPFVNAVKAARPEWQLGWLIEPKSFPIVEGHPAVDRFIVYKRGEGVTAVRQALAEIKSFQPDLVIDLQRILRSAFFTALSGCRERLGFDRKRCKELSWFFTNRKILPRDPGGHMVRQYLEFADYLGIPSSDIHFRVPIAESARTAARTLIPAPFLERGFIAFNVGAAKKANRWPLFRWAQLGKIILDQTPFSLVVTGGRQDISRGRAVGDLLGEGGRVRDCTGKTSLKELGAVFSLARAVVSGDTGPMHISSALGVATVGLFGPADPGRTGPFRHLDLVVRSGGGCSPCGKRRCSSTRCMDEIRPEAVFSVLFPAARQSAGGRKKYLDQV